MARGGSRANVLRLFYVPRAFLGVVVVFGLSRMDMVLVLARALLRALVVHFVVFRSKGGHCWPVASA